MKNLENFFNSKKGKTVAWLCILLVAIFAIGYAVHQLAKKEEGKQGERTPEEIGMAQGDNVVTPIPKIDYYIASGEKTNEKNIDNMEEYEFSTEKLKVYGFQKQEEGEYTIIIGIAKNISEETLENIAFTTNVYDIKDELVNMTKTTIGQLKKGEEVSFQLLAIKQDKEINKVKVEMDDGQQL